MRRLRLAFSDKGHRSLIHLRAQAIKRTCTPLLKDRKNADAAKSIHSETTLQGYLHLRK